MSRDRFGSDVNQSICTVSQMAIKLKLSRARFYQLMDTGVFPPPAYCCSTKKPVYPTRLQGICIEIRRNGIGFNGQLVRFYGQRKKAKPKPEHKQMVAILREMGLRVSIAQVRKAIRKLGLSTAENTIADGESIRELFMHFHGECQ